MNEKCPGPHLPAVDKWKGENMSIEEGTLIAERIRKDALEITGIDMPISGGSGLSRESPIIIEDRDPAKSAYWEHQFVGFIYQMRSESWKFEKATVESVGDRLIEQFKITRSGDDNNYYNFYFDVTDAQGAKNE